MDIKRKFIKENNEFLYNKLMDFLDCEINQSTYNEIIFLLESENVRSMQYEGNQYIIVKEDMNTKIVIIDEIAEEHGVLTDQCRFIIDKRDLIYLIHRKTC